MDTEALLAVTPKEMAQALLMRRQVLRDELPNVIRNLEAEEETLEPKVRRTIDSHRLANDQVAQLKERRNVAQKGASALLKDVKNARDVLAEGDGMINLDPNWKKERLFEELQDIEEKIQTSALDHRSEKKLLDRRKKLLEENDMWLKSRRDANPEMANYIDSRGEMNSLYREADKAHREMLGKVEKAQPLHEKKVIMGAELREIRRQLDRAKELLAQSDSAISHWERRMSDGFGELGGGFPDLLATNLIVSKGGRSSFARKSKAKSKGTRKRGGR
ncbi:MAG: hypothetical protein VX235_05095 [Candidatus Thermoplasmatota archaeon]|nr:hypothetical protein [Arenicellales bacterium]MEE3232429.1 hypothetical protein [Candidatus Thermoplasmatota archaeon]|tara:strand:- start:54 stop:881 length:828 start_codon:yes stop_codon:yes gene_type:complete